MLINISVSKLDPVDGLRAYTEVWGKKGSTLVPVAWLGGIVSIEKGSVSLELNALWLQRAGVSGSLVLRNTYIADVTTSFPIASFSADIPVGNSGVIPIPGFDFMLRKDPVSISYEMRNGVNPRLVNKTSAAADKKGLVLVPGYCASINPWSRNSKDFTDAYFFSEMNLNVPNDEYARKVIAFADKEGLTSFGLIGHSQGGVVAAHIHNYYFSGLEAATGARPIQSVGTPYQGSTAAANAADLGKAFGVGCGANSDLSRDGAVNWLAGISTDARKDVYYFTTTYKRNTFFGDYCSAPMNTLLQWPNDGVTELKYASLQGGKDMGNKDKWCHTTDMSYPAQYDDSARNKDMNANAAR
jgi:pimeloyl-ACP methyl ester carboxylesterase